MFHYTHSLISDVSAAEVEPAAAAALDRFAGAAYSLASRYLLQSLKFRGRAFPYRDLIRAVALEQLNLFELAAVAARELGSHGSILVEPPLEVGGDLIAQLSSNARAEAESASQLASGYEETPNATARAVIARLLVHAVAHRRAFEHALATLGATADHLAPEPDLGRLPEAVALIERGLDRRQYDWTTDGSQLALILRNAADSGIIASDAEPERFSVPTGAAQRDEFAPELPSEIQARAKENSEPKDWKGAPVL